MMGCSGSPDEGKQIGANPYWLSYSPKDEGVKVKVKFVVLLFWLSITGTSNYVQTACNAKIRL